MKFEFVIKVLVFCFRKRRKKVPAAKRRLEKMIIHRSKFNAGAKSVTNSLQSISAQEFLLLLHSKDYCGAVSAGTNGQVFPKEQMDGPVAGQVGPDLGDQTSQPCQHGEEQEKSEVYKSDDKVTEHKEDTT